MEKPVYSEWFDPNRNNRYNNAKDIPEVIIPSQHSLITHVSSQSTHVSHVSHVPHQDFNFKLVFAPGDKIQFRYISVVRLDNKQSSSREEQIEDGIILDIQPNSCYKVKIKDGSVMFVLSSQILMGISMEFFSILPTKFTLYRRYLMTLWSSLIFRRVKKVIPDKNNLLGSMQLDPSTKYFKVFEEEVENKKYPTKYIYSSYYGFTTSVPTRDRDPYRDISIFFGSRNYDEMDFFSYNTGWFGNFYSQDYPPNFSEDTSDDEFNFDFYRNDQIVIDKGYWTPDTHDLICGIVDINSNGHYFKKWFRCSEQFLILYTLLFYPEHNIFLNPEFISYPGKELILAKDRGEIEKEKKIRYKSKEEIESMLTFDYSSNFYENKYLEEAVLQNPRIYVDIFLKTFSHDSHKEDIPIDFSWITD